MTEAKFEASRFINLIDYIEIFFVTRASAPRSGISAQVTDSLFARSSFAMKFSFASNDERQSALLQSSLSF